jgi:putative ubiquitin-RnfH superfamily antitoxin RatB of RatAB toxin-antitoxin module
MTEKMIWVEVAYALPNKQKIIKLDVPEGSTVFQAAVLSSIDAEFSGVDLETSNMGIFGKVVKNPKTQEIKQGQRVEVYRPLLIDPKQARLNRAAKSQ